MRSIRFAGTACRMTNVLGPLLAESDRLPKSLRGHVTSCLRCQVALVRYRKLSTELAALAALRVSAPASLLASAELASAARANRPAAPMISRATAAIASTTAAAAASFVAVAVWRRGRAAA